MKTWEMIKELTENPNKKFRIKLKRTRVAYVSAVGNICLSQLGEKSRVLEFNEEILNTEWEEVKEPVDFMTAIESGYKVRVEHPFISEPHELEQFSNHYRYFTILFEIFGRAWDESDVRNIIINGKWYIED